MRGKDDGSYDSLTSWDESSNIIKIKEAKEADKRRKEAKRKKKKEGPNKKKKMMREKERRDNVTILFPHLCFKVAP